MSKLLKTYIKLKDPSEFQSIAKFFHLLGFGKINEFQSSAGRGMVFEVPVGEVELYAPEIGSNWNGPPGDADFSILVDDSEAAYLQAKNEGYKIVMDSKDESMWKDALAKLPQGVTQEQMEEYRRGAMSAPRNFMADVAGYIIAVSQD
jgi:hypothetical protein